MINRNWIALFLLAGIILGSDAMAAKKKVPTWTDPEKAKAEDPDFSIQGEYGPGSGYGAQVVALGNGSFDAYILEGGLPGDGEDEPEHVVEEGRDDAAVTALGCALVGRAEREVGDDLVAVTDDAQVEAVR